MSKKNGYPNKGDMIDLKEYIDIRINDIQKAADVANDQLDKRLAGMNEFRQSLQDQTTNFLTKSEYQQRHQNLEDKIDALEKLVYMGMGAVLVIEFAFKFFVK